MKKKNKLAEKLRIYKAIHKVTNKYIAEVLGVSRETVSNWCTGKAIPDKGNAAGLCALTKNEITLKDCGYD